MVDTKKTYKLNAHRKEDGWKQEVNAADFNGIVRNQDHRVSQYQIYFL